MGGVMQGGGNLFTTYKKNALFAFQIIKENLT